MRCSSERTRSDNSMNNSRAAAAAAAATVAGSSSCGRCRVGRCGRLKEEGNNTTNNTTTAAVATTRRWSTVGRCTRGSSARNRWNRWNGRAAAAAAAAISCRLAPSKAPAPGTSSRAATAGPGTTRTWSPRGSARARAATTRAARARRATGDARSRVSRAKRRSITCDGGSRCKKRCGVPNTRRSGAGIITAAALGWRPRPRRTTLNMAPKEGRTTPGRTTPPRRR
mmetsp:Transcript_12276/g.44156  ORF Transcript_12276/g.44156 Transcript_12276/m.44156 type:complete len:226 (+) Transcript_12276:1063-1740(+)